MTGIMKRVVVGMSGGVDSTVSALLLRQRGYEVIGVFMRNWDGRDETGHCTADKDCQMAESVAKKLGIKFHEVNLVKEYWTEVFQELVEDYKHGLTPNPDILCNSKVKFTHFFDYAINTIGCDAIATGHYARNSFGADLERSCTSMKASLLKSVDRTKDQTFFLSQIPQEALRKTIFPVGNLWKSEVKDIAREAGFGVIADKKESMGICFVGKKVGSGGRGFQEFMSEYVVDRPGRFVCLETGRDLGKHAGVHQWTIGQRCRINRDYRSFFVASKDSLTNEVFLVDDSQHPALYTETFYTGVPHWIGDVPLELENPLLLRRPSEVEFRFQNMSPLTRCSLVSDKENSELRVSVSEPQRAVTPGQFAAFYLGKVCLGSGRIVRAGEHLQSISEGRKEVFSQEGNMGVL